MPVANVFTRSYYTDLGTKGGSSREEEKNFYPVKDFYYPRKVQNLNLIEHERTDKPVDKIIPQIGDVWQVNNGSYESRFMLLYVRSDGWWEYMDYDTALKADGRWNFSKIPSNFPEDNSGIKYTLIKRLGSINENLGN